MKRLMFLLSTDGDEIIHKVMEQMIVVVSLGKGSIDFGPLGPY